MRIPTSVGVLMRMIGLLFTSSLTPGSSAKLKVLEVGLLEATDGS